MATSGSTQFNLELLDVIEEAGERCGIEIRAGHQVRTARRSLNLLLAEWANRGLNLWTLEKVEVLLAPGVDKLVLPADTVDILEAVLRTGTGLNTQDIPFRFLPALIAGLAYHMAIKIPEGRALLPVLKAQYDEAWMLASDEDREKAPVRFVPRICS